MSPNMPRFAGIPLPVIALAGQTATALGTPPATTGGLHMDIRRSTLDNGLAVITIAQPTHPIASYYTFFRVGSRNERPGITGISHLFEHMMFNGSERYPAGAFDSLLERAGGSSNAYTTEDVTVYTTDFPKESLELVVRLESDRMARLSLGEEMLTSERGVVMEERRQSVEDSPMGVVYEELQAVAYRSHPYRWPVIGWMSDIKRISLEDCQDYFETYYTPSNATVVVVGAIDHDETLATIREHYEDIPTGPSLPAPPPDDEVEPRGSTRIDVERDVRVPILGMAWPTPSVGQADAFTADVVAELLAGGESSRLERHLVREEAIALGVHAWAPWRLGPSLFFILAECDPDDGTDVVSNRVQEEIDRLAGGQLSEREVLRAVTRLRSRFLHGAQTNGGLADVVGSAEIFLGGTDGIDRYLAALADITVEDVAAFCTRYLAGHRSTIARTTPPRDDRATAPAVAPVETSRPEGISESVDPRFVPEVVTSTAPLELADVTRLEGPGGLGIVLVSNPRLPIASVRYMTAAGSSCDPRDRQGLAKLTASLLTLGTTSTDAESIAVAADEMGGALATRVGRESATVQFDLLSEHLERGIDLVADVVLHPTFPQDHFSREREQMRAEADGIEDHPSELSSAGFWDALFPNHPYGTRSAGTASTLGNISLEDVIAFHGKHFRASRSVITVVGRFDVTQAAESIRRAFGEWDDDRAAEGPRSLSVVPASEFRGRRIILREKNDVAQAHVIIGGRGIAIADDGRPALDLANSVLGGAFTSRLNDRLRVELGLTYGVHSAMVPLTGGGAYVIGFSTRTNAVDRAVDEALSILSEYRTTGPTEEELASARAHTRGSFLDRVQLHAAVAGEMAAIEFFDLPDDNTTRHFDALAKVSADEVKEAAARLPEEDLVIYIVGPREIAERIGHLGDVEVVNEPT